MGTVVLAFLVGLGAATVVSQPVDCTDPSNDELCIFGQGTPAKAVEVNSNFSKLENAVATVDAKVDAVNATAHFFSAYANDSFSATSSNVTVPYNYDIADPDGVITNGVFTAPEAGYYYFNARMRFWSGTAGNSLTIRFFVNGSHSTYRFFRTDTSDTFLLIDEFYALNAGDTVDVRVRASSGSYSMFTVNPAPNRVCTFSGFKLY
jgi:hypothetical protein